MKRKKIVLNTAALMLVMLMLSSLVLPVRVFASEVEGEVAPLQEVVAETLPEQTDPPAGPVDDPATELAPPEVSAEETQDGASAATASLEVTAKTYAVVFYNADGSKFEETSVEEGGFAAQPAGNPAAYEGQEFDFWRDKTQADDAKYNFAITAIFSDLELVPVYKNLQQSASIPAEDEPAAMPAFASASLFSLGGMAVGNGHVDSTEPDEYTVTFTVDGQVVQMLALKKSPWFRCLRPPVPRPPRPSWAGTPMTKTPPGARAA